MEDAESGHGPFTAYVDHTFSPTTGIKDDSPVKVRSSSGDLDEVLKAGDRKKLKKFVRNGAWTVTDDIRRVLWWKLSCAVLTDVGSASIYEDMVREVFGEDGKQHQVTMPSFVELSTKEHYHISEAGIHVAKKIICVLGATCPDITYSPLVFPMCCLLLHYLDEADCYNCMYGLVRSNQGYLAQTKKAHDVMKYVLSDLAKKYAKSFNSYIGKRGLQSEGVMENWIWWLFRDLPFTHLVRVTDCYLVEGPKVLYRTALAIINLFHRNIVKASPSKLDGDLDRALSQFCEDLPVSPERLLKVAFSIRGFSRKEIRKQQLKAEIYINSLRNVTLTQTLPKSESCDSLNVKVSSSFSGPLPTNESGIVNDDQFQAIWSWLPTRVTLYEPVLLYTSSEHGTSLATFYGKVDGTEPTLLIIKTKKGEVFGAYCTTDWEERLHNQKQYFGTGETFVFTLLPKKKRYAWVGLKLQDKTPNMASLFMCGDNNSLNIGGGNGVAISLDGNLYKGCSQKCQTFDNPPLVEGEDFECVTIEVFGFKAD